MKTTDTSVDALYSAGKISGRLYVVLHGFGIDDLREIEGVGIKNFRKLRGVGKVLTAELASIAEEAGVAI